MVNRTTIKIRIPIPQSAVLSVSAGDMAKDLVLYEIDQLEILEEVVIDEKKNLKFNVKDGQYINKGDIVFTEGFMGHKAMISDFSGILEIKDNKCRVLGQKKHIEKKISLDGKIIRLVPGKYVVVQCKVTAIKPVVLFSSESKLTPKVYIHSKKDISEDKFKFPNYEYTYFINDNLYVDDLAKVIAFGAKRVIVNGMYIDNLRNFAREINKLDGFAILSGFGEVPARRIVFEQTEMNLFWGKDRVYLSEAVKLVPLRIFEHPFWGMTGKLKKKSDLIGDLDYNNESIEVYLKNVESNG